MFGASSELAPNQLVYWNLARTSFEHVLTSEPAPN